MRRRLPAILPSLAYASSDTRPFLLRPVCAAGRWVVTIPTFAIVGVGVAALAGGAGFNIKQRGMSGAEAVPFINFWRALPPLVMEGARFSFHHAREFSLMVSAKPL